METPSPAPVVVRVEGLVKRFDDKTVVDGLTLDVRAGEWFAFLGPNGSGKSTTIRMMTGMLAPTSGRLEVLGLDPVAHPLEVKRRIGFMPEEPLLYERLTPRETLRFVGPLHGLSIDETDRRAKEIFDLLELSEADQDRFIIDFSMGMRKKVSLAAALIHGPRILFLDEPFNGIDAVTTRAIKDALATAVAKGVSVFFSSHVLEQAERLCSRIAVISKGRLQAHGTLADVRAAAGVAEGASLEEAFVKLVGGDRPASSAGGLGFLG